MVGYRRQIHPETDESAGGGGPQELKLLGLSEACSRVGQFFDTWHTNPGKLVHTLVEGACAPTQHPLRGLFLPTESPPAVGAQKDARADASQFTPGQRVKVRLSPDAKTDMNNIEGLGKAVSALERGMTGFLQTNSAASLRRVFIERADSLGRTDRELLGAFLQGSSEYAPSSGEIVGILKTMQQDMQKDLAGITKTEDQAAAAHNDMVAAQEREMEAATKAIEEKTARVGELSVQEVNLKNDFKDTQDLLKENTEMARKLKEDCSVRAAEYDQRQKMRTEIGRASCRERV